MVRTTGRVEKLAEIGDIVVAAHRDIPSSRQGSRGHHHRSRLADRQRQHRRPRDRARHRAHARRRQQPHGRGRGRRQARRNQSDAAAGHPRAARLEPDGAGRRHGPHRRHQSHGRRRARHPRAPAAARKLPRRGHHRARHSGHHADHRRRHAGAQDQRQPHEPRRARLRADRRRRRHHRGEQPAAPRRAPARARPRSAPRRAPRHGRCGIERSHPADGLRAMHHRARLRSAADLLRHRGQDVPADGADRHHRARHRLRAFAHLHAGDDRDLRDRTGGRARERLRARPQDTLSAGAGVRHSPAARAHRCGSCPVRWRRAAVHASRPGIHPAARREEHRHGGEAHPEHVAVAIASDAVHQREDAAPLSAGGFRLFPRRHAGPRRRPDAAERDRHLHHPEAA